MNGAAENGDLHVVQWLHYDRTEGGTTLAIEQAVQNKHWHVVKWLAWHCTEGCGISTLVMIPHLESVQCLYAMQHAGETDTITFVPRTGSLEVVMWLVDECGFNIGSDAVRDGNRAFGRVPHRGVRKWQLARTGVTKARDCEQQAVTAKEKSYRRGHGKDPIIAYWLRMLAASDVWQLEP